MADQSAFDRNRIETSAVSQTSDILDQLNLPPAMTLFLRKNQRAIWVIVSILVITVVSVALYDSYSNYQSKQAVSALDTAKQAEGEKRVELLQQVTEKYASTPSALWARVELAKIASEKKDRATAIAELKNVDGSISGNNPMKPLVLYRLAGLYEENGDLDTAIGLYQELAVFTGFTADAHYAMGRVYVAMDKKPEAIAQYNQYLSLTEKAGGNGQQDPVRARVEYTIKQLQ
ncbi:MAG TPA: tetratricopeptide repeat protein [Desulfobulbus sp.]|nr:tetratricopeptide repeat protein [Desulfobulbus sp.]